MVLFPPALQPFPQRLLLQEQSPFRDGRYPVSFRPPDPGWAIANSAELLEAIAEADAGDSPVTLYLATNEYPEVSNMVAGRDFTGKHLKIRGSNPASRPLVVNSPQSLILTRNVEISDVDFELGTVALGTWHFADGGGVSEVNACRDFSLINSKLTGISKDLNAVPSPTYREGMCDGIRFTCSHSYNHIIDNVETDFMNRAMEIKMNGRVLIRDFTSRHAYYDNIRIVGQGDEGYVDGNRYIIRANILDGIGSYEEINDGEPHLDGVQCFNATGTNTRIENLFIYQLLMNHGELRGSSIQSFIAQVPLINVWVVEAALMTKGAPHGFYLEGGGGVGLERVSMADWNWYPGIVDQVSSVRGRTFKMTGEVVYKDVITLAAIDAPTTGDNANLPGYALRSINTDYPAGSDGKVKHAAVYSGAGSRLGVDGTKEMLAPLTDNGRGCFTTEGEWRGLTTHLPTEAAAPEATGGVGQIAITEIKKPTLGLHDIEMAEEPTYKYNARVCVADSHTWTEIQDATTSTVFDELAPGSYWVQTQCVNSSDAGDAANAGAWSKTKTVTVT